MAALIYHHLTGVAQPISPSSHAAEANGIVALTGQFGRNLSNPDAPLPEGIVAQTDQTINVGKRMGSRCIAARHASAYIHLHTVGWYWVTQTVGG